MGKSAFFVMLSILLFLAFISCDDDNNNSNDDDSYTDDDSGDDDGMDDDDDDPADDDTYIGNDDDSFVGDWFIDTIDRMDGEIFEFMYTSIELDSMEIPHIAFFYMDYPYGLRLAKPEDDEWIIQRMFTNDKIRGFASYELDDNDIGHMAIQQIITTAKDEKLKILSYATDKNGTWEHEVISDNVNEEYLEVGWYASLAVDVDNKMHVSCYGLSYFNNVNGSWDLQGNDSCNLEAGGGLYTSIAIDGDSEVHITHGGCDNTEYCQRYTTNVGGWHGECIPNTQDKVNQSSIAVDQNGKVIIAFNIKFEQTYSLHIATKSVDEWTTKEIDPNISLYCGLLSDSYLALDSDGNAHIAYTGLDDTDNTVLKYATNISGEWTTEIIDPSPYCGIGASIVIDDEGYAHISYYDNLNISLKYATNKP